MHVAIDAVGAKEGGAATVLSSLLESALRRYEIDTITVFCSPRSCRSFDVPPSDRVIVEEKPYAEKRFWRLAWHFRGLPMAVGARCADVVLCLGGGGLAPRAVPSVMLVQQMLVFSSEVQRELPWRERLRLRLIRISMRLGCRRSDRIIVQTRTMREHVIARFGVDPKRVDVVEPAGELPECDRMPDPRLAPMRQTPVDRRVLYVGANWPYKNLQRLVAAVGQLSADIPSLRLFLTLPETDALCHLPWVVGLGYLPRTALREAYEHATVLVMPSLAETVGLPMLEAASVGVPILAADRPYAHDVCGSAAAYFDPLSVEDLAAALRAILVNPERRVELARCARELAEERSAAEPYGRIIEIVCRVAKRSSVGYGRRTGEVVVD